MKAFLEVSSGLEMHYFILHSNEHCYFMFQNQEIWFTVVLKLLQVLKLNDSNMSISKAAIQKRNAPKTNYCVIIKNTLNGIVNDEIYDTCFR